MAQVHRFRDCAAIYAGDGQTVYMTAKEAARLAKALNAIARSIKRERFGDSSGLTVEFTTFLAAHDAQAAQGEVKRG